MANPSFEKANSTTGDVSSTGVITDDWNITTLSYARCAIFNSSSTVATYGGTTSASDGSYYLMIRSNLDQGKTQNIKQNSDMSLPKGAYQILFDYKAARVKNVNRNLIVSAINGSTNLASTTIAIPQISANSSYIGSIDWTTASYDFTLQSPTNVRVNISCETQGTANNASSQHTVVLLDNFVIKYSNINVDKLSVLIAHATNLNSKIGTLTTDIKTAQDVLDGVDNTPDYQDDIDDAISALQSAINSKGAAAVSTFDPAGEDVTAYIYRAGFEGMTAETTDYTTNKGKDYSTEGWTLTTTDDYAFGAVIEYASEGKIKGAAIPSTDKSGNTGNALGISVGWQDTQLYKSEKVKLPPGSYQLKVEAYNAGTATSFISKLGFEPEGGSAVVSTKNSFAVGEWVTDEVNFTLDEATVGCFQVGGTAGNTTTDNHGKVFFDNITLTYVDLLKKAQLDWADAKAAAEAARDHDDYTNITGSERTALESAISTYGSEPDEISDCETAIEALNDATATFIAAKGSYDALAAKRTEATSNYTTVKWPYASSTKKTALDEAVADAPDDAADAVTKTNAIVTAIRYFVESNGVAEGQANAVAKTSKLLVHDADVSTSGWTSGSIDNDNVDANKYTKADGTKPGKYFNGGWSGSAGVDITLTQELTLPAGDYLLQITARGSKDLDTYTMSVGEEVVNLPKNDNAGGEFGNGWSDKFLTFTSDGSAVTLTITASSEAVKQWISFDRLRLTRINVSTLATAEDYSNLNSAINTVEGNFGFEEGEYAPYNNVTGINKLAEVKAINQEVNNAQDEIRAWTTYLNTSSNWTANAAEVNAIYDGDFNIQPEHTTGPTTLKGWTAVDGIRQLIKNKTTYPGLDYASQNAAIFTWGGTTITYGAEDGYTLPMGKYVYKLTFKVAGWSDGDLPTEISATLKKGGVTKSSSSLNPNVTERINVAEGNPFKEVSFYLCAPEAGNYTLEITSNKHTVYTDFNLVKATALTINDTDADVLKGFTNEVDITVNRKLVADKWQGFSLPFSLTAEEIAASALNGASIAEFDSDKDNTGTVIYFKAATAIEAGVPYLIKPAEGDDIESMTFTGKTIAADVEAQTMGTGDYQFAAQLYYDTSLPTDGTIAYMSTGEGNKVKKLISGGSGIKGTRAYFIIPSGVAPARIVFEGDEVTSIDGTEFIVQDSAKDVYYDLQGRKVTGKPTQRGIYIVNGKKMFVK